MAFRQFTDKDNVGADTPALSQSSYDKNIDEVCGFAQRLPPSEQQFIRHASSIFEHRHMMP